jgi:hypothetical protein
MLQSCGLYKRGSGGSGEPPEPPASSSLPEADVAVREDADRVDVLGADLRPAGVA